MEQLIFHGSSSFCRQQGASQTHVYLQEREKERETEAVREREGEREVREREREREMRFRQKARQLVDVGGAHDTHLS